MRAPEAFPDVYAADPVHRGSVVGGTTAARAALQAVDPASYARTRNHVDGAVTRLSPYLRHGVLTLAEVRDHVLSVATREQAWKLVDELSWRDFYRRAFGVLGWEVWSDLQPYATGHPAVSYADELPTDIADGSTGLACVDAWSEELRTTGYLHNHVRMWLAAYVVHHRRVRWQAGARWFLRHLLDGDTASNNLSWQWVASTWRARPYFFNRANVQKYAGDRWCAGCPVRDVGCPFATSYETLADRLFADTAPPPRGSRPTPDLVEVPRPAAAAADDRPALVWVHGERLSPDNEALAAHPESPAVFVWDRSLVEDATITAKRLTFLDECLDDVRTVRGVDVRLGSVVDEVRAAASAAGVGLVATTPSPSPRFARFVTELEDAGLEVDVRPESPFVRPTGPLRLTSHAAYWRQVQATAFG